ncbi:hypothetical protein [Desulfuribacillus alkaliarsenatis]|uniref:Prolipoprotein diacylglyceryl transferase n=1 Tax=Desulfuribacillus alkaliarsenatis TaxID=766136 RepID=A0A1E5G6K5_9FIRM|nr:hypothetical protein [Desulfuribacillus alkaliarsenatis]OEF98384.1 hypothetical protein BHF68_01520 [Desulfuribacillus alkaliarsenatis]
MINSKWWDYTHNTTFYIAITIIGYVLIRIYYDRLHAPSGVCPVYSYQWIINVGIAFAVMYFLMGIIKWTNNRFTRHTSE